MYLSANNHHAIEGTSVRKFPSCTREIHAGAAHTEDIQLHSPVLSLSSPLSANGFARQYELCVRLIVKRGVREKGRAETRMPIAIVSE